MAYLSWGGRRVGDAPLVGAAGHATVFGRRTEGAEVIQWLPVMDGQGGALVARGTLGGGVRALEGLADGAHALGFLQDFLLAFDVLGGAPSALNGVPEALIASVFPEYACLAFGVVLDWLC